MRDNPVSLGLQRKSFQILFGNAFLFPPDFGRAIFHFMKPLGLVMRFRAAGEQDGQIWLHLKR